LQSDRETGSAYALDPVDLDDETREIGYEEDGDFWLTVSSSVPDADAAEKHMQPSLACRAGGPYRCHRLAPDHKDEQWAECASDQPRARGRWRLVPTGSEEIFEGGAVESKSLLPAGSRPRLTSG
jgi:hypothetical protein